MKKARAVPKAKASVVQIAMRQAAVQRSGAFENIPDSTDGVNQRPNIGRIDLVPQPVNMHVDNISCGIDSHFPDMIEDHGASHDPPFIADKILQQGEFLRRELKLLIATPSFAADKIQTQIRDL